MESKGELKNDDATVPRGPTEQAGILLDMGKNAKSQEEEGGKVGRREYTAGANTGEVREATWFHLEVQPDKPTR